MDVARILALGLACWLFQALVVSTPGGAFWSWDWQHHYHMSTVVWGLLSDGRLPITNGRTSLLGLIAVPFYAMAGGPSFPVWQIVCVITNGVAAMAVAALWGYRLRGEEGAIRAVAAIAVCAGIAQSSVFTWPKVLCASLIVLTLWLWTERRHWAAVGVVLWLAFQAHQQAALYAAPFFAVTFLAGGWRECRWYGALTVYAVLLGAWLYARWDMYGAAGITDNQYTSWSNLVNPAEFWRLFSGNIAASVSPHYLGGYFVDPSGWLTREGYSILYRPFYDVLLLAITPVALLGVWRIRDWVPLVTLVLGAALCAAIQDNSFSGLAQASWAPLLLFLIAAGAAYTAPEPRRNWSSPPQNAAEVELYVKDAAAAWDRSGPGLTAAISPLLWVVSFGLFAVLRVGSSIERAYFADAYNLGVKAELRAIADTYPVWWAWVGMVVTFGLLVRATWREVECSS